jgi:Cys-rich repeat protein
MRLVGLFAWACLAVGAVTWGCSSSSSDTAGTAASAGTGGKTDGGGGTAASGGTGGGSGGTGGSAATGGAGTGGAAGVGGSGGCSANSDCAAPTPVCDTSSSTCVECLPTDDQCPTGQYCAGGNSCASGCSDGTDCSAPTTQCDTSTNQCVECLTDSDCPSGEICAQNACAQGCSATQPCVNATETCCGSSCHDLQTDTNDCGACGTQCPTLPNASSVCNAGQCGMGACAGGFSDCDQNASNGCEVNQSIASCVCTPGQAQSCYTGPSGTQGVGACTAGSQTCDVSGLFWGPCLNQVVPSPEVCANGVDEDCNATVDDVPDVDGDGWTKCNGDCCETTTDCSDPPLVNPGAFEFPGNNVDDDCDGTTDNALANCDSGLSSSSNNALDYAKAIDLCQTTQENPASQNQKKWGVIAGWFYRANGAGSPASGSKSIRAGFGNNVSPKKGSTLAVLSTGVAAAQAAPNNTNPNYAAFQGGQDMGTSSGVPADWLSANGNNFPNAPGCPDPQNGTTAHDPIMLKLRIRVPTNAKSFTVNSYFFSSEYPEWVCSPYNDFFLTLLDSAFVPGPGEVPNPADKNLAFFDPPPAGGAVYPVGVNLAFGNTGLFRQCKNGPTGCGTGSVAGNTNTCVGFTELSGTGMDVVNPPPEFGGDPGWCGTSNLSGGGTSWLNESGNIKPGETIEVRFVIWDTGDQWYDSVVLLDNWIWNVTASQPGTTG